MAHHGRSIRRRVIALGGGGCSVLKSTARAWLQKYWRDGQVGRSQGTGLRRISSPAQDVALVAEAQRNLLIRARNLKAATGFPGQINALISRLKETGFRARHAAVLELLTDEHILYHLAFTDSNVDHKWDRLIL
jgi:hypothetical protein